MMRGLFDNLALKLASLGLALVLWFVIAGEKTSEIGMTVPVEMQNVPQALELTGEAVNTVDVRLRATPGVIQRLGPGDISAQVDLAGLGEGERIIHLTPEAIRVPFGVRVVKINPAILTLTFERTLQKVVPVRPRLLGRPAAGYEVAQVSSTPPEVRISGPTSRVKEVESAFTEPVSIEGADTTIVETVSLGLEDPALRVLDNPRVRVAAQVREVHEKRAFDGLLVGVRGGTATVTPARVRVVLEGPASALRVVAPESVRSYVELGQLQGRQLVPVAVELVPGPPGVTVHHTEPAQVSVRVLRRKE
jgi:YbbR domain-containing protein